MTQWSGFEAEGPVLGPDLAPGTQSRHFPQRYLHPHPEAPEGLPGDLLSPSPVPVTVAMVCPERQALVRQWPSGWKQRRK